MNESVFWPVTERVIGVLGLNPRATSVFFSQLVAKKVKKEWEHPRIIIDSNPKIPSRGRCLELGERSPVPYMVDAVAGLIEQGASIIAVPCNTAHIFYEEYASQFSVSMPHICEVAADAAYKANYNKVLVLGSSSTMRYGIYQRAFDKRGISSEGLDDQKLVTEAIEMVKQNMCDKLLVEALIAKIRAKKGIDAVLLGCTEFSVIKNIFESFAIIDSSQQLAEHCLMLSRA